MDRARLAYAYRQAHEAWQRGALPEAEQILRASWAAEGVRTLRGQLLLAYVLRDAGRPVTELETLQTLLESLGDAPERDLVADAWSMAGEALRLLGESGLAASAFLQAAEIEPDAGEKLVECSNAIFAANAIEGVTAGFMQGLYARYRAFLARLAIEPLPSVYWHHAKLRIGYLSADLRDHPVASFVQPLFCAYDKARFSVYAYSLAAHEDAVTERLRAGGAAWRRMNGQSVAQIAAQIRADEIDVLVDLAGHTAGNALPVFAYRPAPAMLSGIGYMGSTGLFETSGFLSDTQATPDVVSPYFVEPLMRLPQSHFCYQPYGAFPAVGVPPCLSRGFVTFGCFNHFSKITDAMLMLWARILSALPDARLVLKHKLLGMEEGRAYARRRLARMGLPLDRVELRGYSAGHLAEYHDIDIALDTSPYTGGLTTCEALYMGVPVVTLAGAYHGARFGVSLLGNAGLSELVAEDGDGYVALAVQLAQDKALITSLRQGLRARMTSSSLMDGNAYVRAVERLYLHLAEDGFLNQNDTDAHRTGGE